MIVRRVFVVLLTTMVALDLLVVVLRSADVLWSGRLVIFPAEGPVLYAIWKIRHGHSLYEWPLTPPFTLTLYNFLFYRTYAAGLQVLQVPDTATPVVARFFTLLCSIAGAACQFATARRLFGADRLPAPVVALLAVTTWVGVGFPGWWAFSIRPDVPATACTAAALWTVAIASSGGRRAWFGAAGIAFLGAWFFKQSQIGLFLATCVYVLGIRRAPRDFVWLATPFAAGVLLALAIGGATYRVNIITAPSLNPLVPFLAVHWYQSIALINALPWTLCLCGLGALLHDVLATKGRRLTLARLPEVSRGRFGVDLTLAMLTTIVTFGLSLVLLSKIGSALNHALELNLAASLLATGVLAGSWSATRSRVPLGGAIALLPMLAFTVLLLTGREHGRLATALQLKVWGDALRLGSAGELADRRRLLADAERLPAPIYWDDETVPPLWHSLEAHYPGAIIDHVFFDGARRRGLIATGIDELFRRQYFGAAVLPDSSEYLPAAVRAGYRVARTFAPATPNTPPLRLVVRGR